MKRWWLVWCWLGIGQCLADCVVTDKALLTQRSLVVVTLAGGQVDTGMWYGAYTDRIFYSADNVSVDQLVSATWAQRHGAETWPRAKLNQLARDVDNRVIVYKPMDQRKGEMGISDWLPENARCVYIHRFKAIVAKYGLLFDASDRYVMHYFCNGTKVAPVDAPVIAHWKNAIHVIDLR